MSVREYLRRVQCWIVGPRREHGVDAPTLIELLLFAANWLWVAILSIPGDSFDLGPYRWFRRWSPCDNECAERFWIAWFALAGLLMLAGLWTGQTPIRRLALLLNGPLWIFAGILVALAEPLTPAWGIYLLLGLISEIAYLVLTGGGEVRTRCGETE